MAENRTFQFYGNGYGDGVTPASITATVAGTTIYSGPVQTFNLPIDPPPLYDPVSQVVLFEIANSAALNTDFAGSVNMTITVNSGYGVNFGQIDSNYYRGNVEVDPNAGTVNNYAQNYFGNPPNSEGTQDPRSSVVIDSVPETAERPPNGTWNWLIPAGSVFSYNWNISTGQVSNVAGNTSTYTGPYTTTAPT